MTNRMNRIDRHALVLALDHCRQDNLQAAADALRNGGSFAFDIYEELCPALYDHGTGSREVKVRLAMFLRAVLRVDLEIGNAKLLGASAYY